MTNEMDNIASDKELSGVYPTAVHAVKNGDVEIITSLLHEYPDLVNARSQKGRTLLHHVCDWPGYFPNEIETARKLIAAGADINARACDPDKGETSLQWVVSSNDVAMAEMLIESGASVNGLNKDLRPLAQALFYGNREVAEMLVRRGATVTLEFAAGLGRVELMQSFFGVDGSLLSHAGPHTAPINDAIPSRFNQDELLEQALIYAVVNTRIESIIYLLDRGADINAMPSGFHFHGTPLHWAAAGESLDMVELLVRREADMYAKAPKDMATPIDIAKSRRQEEIVRLLMRLGGTH